eukprot:4982215-Prymnesium_polylepis.3
MTGALGCSKHTPPRAASYEKSASKQHPPTSKGKKERERKKERGRKKDKEREREREKRLTSVASQRRSRVG